MGQFAISKSEVQRIATVAKLEQETLERIVNTETPIAVTVHGLGNSDGGVCFEKWAVTASIK